MTENHTEKTILEKIQQKEIAMKSKSFFVVRAILLALGGFIAFLFLLYIISFVVFSLQADGAWFLPDFGFMGYQILFGKLPWLLVFSAIALIALLEIFAEQFSFIYRRPMMYSVTGIIVIVIIGGALVSKAEVHEAMFRIARDGRLPVFDRLYIIQEDPCMGRLYHGMVSEITNEGFIMQNPQEQMFTVITGKDCNILFHQKINQGDRVVVIGDCDDSIIDAEGVKKINTDINIFPDRGNPKMYNKGELIN